MRYSVFLTTLLVLVVSSVQDARQVNVDRTVDPVLENARATSIRSTNVTVKVQLSPGNITGYSVFVIVQPSPVEQPLGCESNGSCAGAIAALTPNHDYQLTFIARKSDSATIHSTPVNLNITTAPLLSSPTVVQIRSTFIEANIELFINNTRYYYVVVSRTDTPNEQTFYPQPNSKYTGTVVGFSPNRNYGLTFVARKLGDFTVQSDPVKYNFTTVLPMSPLELLAVRSTSALIRFQFNGTNFHMKTNADQGNHTFEPQGNGFYLCNLTGIPAGVSWGIMMTAVNNDDPKVMSDDQLASLNTAPIIVPDEPTVGNTSVQFSVTLLPQPQKLYYVNVTTLETGDVYRMDCDLNRTCRAHIGGLQSNHNYTLIMIAYPVVSINNFQSDPVTMLIQTLSVKALSTPTPTILRTTPGVSASSASISSVIAPPELFPNLIDTTIRPNITLDVSLTVSLHEQCPSYFEDENSPEYMRNSEIVINELNRVLSKQYQEFNAIEMQSLRCGSLIIDFRVLLYEMSLLQTFSLVNISNNLVAALDNMNFTLLNIDVNYDELAQSIRESISNMQVTSGLTCAISRCDVGYLCEDRALDSIPRAMCISMCTSNPYQSPYCHNHGYCLQEVGQEPSCKCFQESGSHYTDDRCSQSEGMVSAMYLYIVVPGIAGGLVFIILTVWVARRIKRNQSSDTGSVIFKPWNDE